MTPSQRALNPTRRRNIMMLVAIAGLLVAIFLNLEPAPTSVTLPPPERLTTDVLENILASSPGAASTVVPIPTAKLAVLELPLLIESGLVNIAFQSEPSGAKVYVDNTLRGVTPLTVKLPSGIPTPYRVSAEGAYESSMGILSFTEDDEVSVQLRSSGRQE